MWFIVRFEGVQNCIIMHYSENKRKYRAVPAMCILDDQLQKHTEIVGTALNVPDKKWFRKSLGD